MFKGSVRSSAALARWASLLTLTASIPLSFGQTSSLVAYYPLNGDGQDASGNEHHGSVTGTVTTSDRYGNLQGALAFAADSDRVNCGNPAAFNFSGPFSISAWVKTDGTRSDTYIVAKYDFDFGTFTGSPHSYGLGTAGATIPYAFIGNESGFVDTLGFSSPISVGSWYALAVVYDGTFLNLYVNGNAVSSSFVGQFPPFVNSVPLTIGGTSVGQVFGGSIDDVRLYNGALSPEEILAQYNADLPTTPPPAQALVAHYALNGDAKDKSGNGLHGTLVGTTLIPDRFGKKDRALFFNGGSDRVLCGNPAQFNFTSSFTLSAWVKMEGPQFEQYVVAKYDFDFSTGTSSPYSYGLGIANTDPYGFVGGESGYTDLFGHLSLADSDWHAISFVYEAGHSLRLYLDGEVIASRPVGILPPFLNSVPLTIGGTSTGQGFVGGIDDVRIFSKALSNSEISEQFEADSPQLKIRPLKHGLVAHYQMDGNARDQSRHKLHGILIGSSPTADRFGQPNKALFFDGNMDRMNCGNPAQFNFTNDFTLSAWVKLDGDQTDNYIVAKYEFDFNTFTGAPNSYGLGLNGFVDPYGFVAGDFGFADVRGYLNINDGAWHFLSLTYDSHSLRLFLDGALIQQGFVGPLPPFINSLPLTIGGTASGQGFRGAIDSVRIYNRALSPSEIAALYLR
jgi:hypothetical protein